MKDPIHEYSLTIDDIVVDLQHIIAAMGYRNGTEPAAFVEMLAEWFEQAKQHIDLRCGFVLLPPGETFAGSGQIHLKGITFHSGRIVAGPLKKMEQVALFAGTVGPDFDKWSRSTFNGGDPLAGYLIDLIGSELAESVADWVENKIVSIAKPQGLFCSNRYSPGYCGWSVAEQHKLFSFLPENFCGISLTSSALMKPHKSISGIIGIGSKIKRKEYPCNVCKMEECYKNRLPGKENG